MKLAVTLFLAAFSLLGQTKSALDKPTLEAYLRYSELWVPQVTVTIDDPKPSTVVKDYFDVWVHLAYNGQSKDELYYISKDGSSVVRGVAYNIAKSPFASDMDHLKRMHNQASAPRSRSSSWWSSAISSAPFAKKKRRNCARNCRARSATKFALTSTISR